MPKSREELLEDVLAQMLKPVRNVPFSVIIRSLAGRRVIPVDRNDPADVLVLGKLEEAIRLAADRVKLQPIRRPRPNEVGNDIEAYVQAALVRAGFRAERPTSAAGKGKSTGYPDLLFYDEDNRPHYLECKICAEGTEPTSMRSFYLSPSESFKVALDARHLLLAYGMRAVAVAGSRDSAYTPHSFRLVDLHDLLCDVKYEFNSDNKRLYATSIVLLQGTL
jgi:hypothetical protein